MHYHYTNDYSVSVAHKVNSVSCRTWRYILFYSIYTNQLINYYAIMLISYYDIKGVR